VGREQRAEDSGQRTVGRGQWAENRGQKAERAERKVQINSVKDMIVYKKAYELAMAVFDLSKKFPAEEKYALMSQIRRSSRSVCLNLREAWAKRRYEAHFVSKLTDCDGECNETDSSLDFAKDCHYITESQHEHLTALNDEIGKMLGSMLNNPASFLLKPKTDI
jgi:four helix bundle protein